MKNKFTQTLSLFNFPLFPLGIPLITLLFCYFPYVNAEKLTIERLYSAPNINGQSLKNLTISPDAESVTYLKSKSEGINNYDLWQYNIATNSHELLVDANKLLDESSLVSTKQLSDEEKSRRERQRIDASGIIEYEFSNDGSALLFPLNGDVFYYHLPSKTAKRLTQTKTFETDIKFSPNGNFVSFIRQQNIFIVNIANGKERQLTKDGGGVIKNGMAEFVAQEEMGRMTGYWWSPDEKNIAFIRVDESSISTTIRNETYAEEIKLVTQRYPFTGTNNVKVQLAYVDIKGKKTRFIDTGDQQDFYLPRVKWLPYGEHLSYQWQSRDQKTLSLNIYTLASKKQAKVITEKAKHWLNLHDDLYFLNDNKSFIWASERDGFKHLYRFNYQGELLAQLTQGQWVVDKVEYIDEANGWVYFTGRADTPLERHLYKVPLDGKSPEHVVRISKASGFHHINFSQVINRNLKASNKKSNAGVYLDRFSNISTPEQVYLHNINDEKNTLLSDNVITNTHPLHPYANDLIEAEFGALTADDSNSELFYQLFKPQHMEAGKKYPVIVHVYGGAHVQRVTNQWQDANLIQYMVQQGYIVFQLDNRGSNYRGQAFEATIYKHLAQVEVVDQITGVKFLHTLPYVDKDRIGVFGHSYGGYMALMSLLKAGEYFKAGVAGSPVTDWQLYDTHYTERYLSHPKSNPEGYQKSSVFPYIKNLSAPLLIYHGMADDNVLFTHTTKLIKALQDENKPFELMTYPGSKHSMRGEKVKVHLNHTIINFFNRHFKNEQL